MEKRKPSYTVSENANWYSHSGETVWRFLKKLEIELRYGPAIPLLGIHSEETRRERDMCTSMFIATLFIIARTWKQPKFLLLTLYTLILSITWFKIFVYLF